MVINQALGQSGSGEFAQVFRMVECTQRIERQLSARRSLSAMTSRKPPSSRSQPRYGGQISVSAQ